MIECTNIRNSTPKDIIYGYIPPTQFTLIYKKRARKKKVHRAAIQIEVEYNTETVLVPYF